MTNHHPIVPSPEQVDQWFNDSVQLNSTPKYYIATKAAQWGGDQELEAMLAELKALHLPDGYAAMLRAARRPKPPSLKEQALDELIAAERLYPADWSTIRRALEALDD